MDKGMEEVLDKLCIAIAEGAFLRALGLQHMLRIDICARLARKEDVQNLSNVAWLATVDPRSRAAKRAALFSFRSERKKA